MRFLAYLLVPLIVFLPGCGALAAQRLDALSSDIKEVRKHEEVAREQADANKDGKLSGMEIVTYLGLLAAGAETLRRKLKSLDAKHEASAEDRERLEARIDWEREKRKDAEVAGLKAMIQSEDERLRKERGA